MQLAPFMMFVLMETFVAQRENVLLLSKVLKEQHAASIWNVTLIPTVPLTTPVNHGPHGLKLRVLTNRTARATKFVCAIKLLVTSFAFPLPNPSIHTVLPNCNPLFHVSRKTTAASTTLPLQILLVRAFSLPTLVRLKTVNLLLKSPPDVDVPPRKTCMVTVTTVNSVAASQSGRLSSLPLLVLS